MTIPTRDLERLARYACKPWAGSRHYPDCLQEARLGVWRASQRYDPALGTFATYAVSYARGAVLHYLRDTTNLIRIPAYRTRRPGNPRCVTSTDDPDYRRPDDPVEPFEPALVLDSLLDALPPLHARAFRLLSEGYDRQEIGRQIGLHPNTVGRWIMDDRRRLARAATQ